LSLLLGACDFRPRSLVSCRRTHLRLCARLEAGLRGVQPNVRAQPDDLRPDSHRKRRAHVEADVVAVETEYDITGGERPFGECGNSRVHSVVPVLEDRPENTPRRLADTVAADRPHTARPRDGE